MSADILKSVTTYNNDVIQTISNLQGFIDAFSNTPPNKIRNRYEDIMGIIDNKKFEFADALSNLEKTKIFIENEITNNIHKIEEKLTTLTEIINNKNIGTLEGKSRDVIKKNAKVPENYMQKEVLRQLYIEPNQVPRTGGKTKKNNKKRRRSKKRDTIR